jgi:hypothetical protein
LIEIDLHLIDRQLVGGNDVDQIGVGRLERRDSARIKVVAFDGLVIEAARRQGASIMIRGLRDGTDLDYEMQMAGMNETMAPELQTVFLPASPSARTITATLVRQIASMGGDIRPFVPAAVADALTAKFAKMHVAQKWEPVLRATWHENKMFGENHAAKNACLVAGLDCRSRDRVRSAFAADPENTMIITLKDGDVTIALRPDLAEACRADQEAGAQGATTTSRSTVSSTASWRRPAMSNSAT